MSGAARSETDTGHRGDELSFLFAQMVMQQSNMAMMLLGKVVHPESGKVVQDLEAARLFIDQLEMLEAKTKGNLSKEEESLLKQTLMNLRLMYVETVESAPSAARPPTPSPATPPPDQPKEGVIAGAGESTSASPSGTEEEHRKKFSKKY